MNNLDPSRTAILRNSAVELVNTHYRGVLTSLRLYLKNYKPGKFMPEEVPTVIENFHVYFLKLLNKDFVGNSKLSKILKDSYIRGVKRSIYTLKAKELINTSTEFARGVEATYVRSLVQNNQIDKLTSFSFNSIDTINQSIVNRISTSVYEGIRADYDQLKMYEIMRSAIQTQAVPRARTTVRTEIVRSQACGILDSFSKLGIDTVMVDIEKPSKFTKNSNKNADNECLLCKPLQNKVFTVQEAYGIIPVHPNCRCSFLAVGTENMKLPVMLNDVISDNE